MFRLYVTQLDSTFHSYNNQSNTELFDDISAKGINHVIDKYNELAPPLDNDNYFIWKLQDKTIRLDIINNSTNKTVSPDEFMCLNP